MSEPIVFISAHRIKEGKLDGFTRLSREMTPLIEADKPATLLFQAYLDEESNQVSIVHVFADAETMDLHFQGADERSEKAYEFIQPERFEIYGAPSDQALAMLRQAEGQGVDVIVKARPLFGFIRIRSA